MTTFIAGGTGFIGRRLVPLLAQRGEEIVCMDINPQTADFGQLGKQVKVVRGDVSQFDDVMAAMTAAKPNRVINLAYWIGSEHRPRAAFKLNVLGMDNVFEAARLAGCNRVAYASSLAVSGEQKFFGDRMVTEDDFRHGHVQYAMHKIFNEWQAQDYREKHGMEITAIRPANVTGPDKIVGTDIDPQTADFGNPGKQVKVTRPVSGFGVQYRPYRERVLQIINDIRKEEGLPELARQ